jgi:hypothetical protein
MRIRYLVAALAVAASLGAAVAWSLRDAGARTTGAGGTRSERTADDRPNFNGIWQAMNSANWDLEAHPARPGVPSLGTFLATPPGRSVVEGGTIPYRPEAAEQRRKNFEQRWTADPEAKCFYPGVPRATYMPFPFQIVQSRDTVLIAYEYASAVRTIHMDRPRDAPIDSWMGTSNGKWESDTLVVDVKGFNDQTWFDRAGNFHSDALHVVERYGVADANTLTYEATIEDSNVFTRPWKISMPLYRRVEPHAQLLEFKCVEFAEDMMYGHLRKGAKP